MISIGATGIACFIRLIDYYEESYRRILTMARTCGNCLKSINSIDYIPAEKVGIECLCTEKDEFLPVEHSPCDEWVGDIKEKK